jgi:membrane protein
MERHSRKKLIITVFKEFFQERSFLHGAALAYYAVFALVPILYLSVAVFGRVVGHNTMVEIITKFLNEQIGLADVSGILDFLNTMQLSKGNVLMEVIGILALMISSTAILNSLRMSINDFYDLEKLKGRRRKIVRGLLFRLLSMAFIAGATVVLVVFYFAETVFLSLGNDLLADYDTLNRIFAFAAHMGIPLLANTIVFACVFKFLHDGKVVWRRAIEGALITGILLYLGQLIIQYYLTNHFFGSGGGVVGTILIILVWVYYSSQIIFLGAKYIAVKSRISGQTIQLRD